MVDHYRKMCICVISLSVVCLSAAVSWAGQITGKVDIVLRDTLVIGLDSDVFPNVGDKIEIVDSSPSGSPVLVGKWEVSKVKENSVIAKKVEASGDPVKGMKAVIFSDNAANVPAQGVQPSLPTPPPVIVPGDASSRKAPQVERQNPPVSLGIIIQDMTPDLMGFFNVPSETRGVIVKSVVEGKPAQRAGLETGDVITAFNGETVRDAVFLVSMVSALSAGTTVNLKVVRKGWEKNISVPLDGTPGGDATSSMIERPSLAEGPAEAEEYYKKGAAYADSKQYSEGIPWLKKAADLNHAKAQNYLGLMYLNGYNVQQDFAVAAQLFQKAADNGYAFGNFNLARIHENGWGVPKNERLAEEYYQKSGDYIAEYKRGARMGEKEAQLWLRTRGIAWQVQTPVVADVPGQTNQPSPPVQTHAAPPLRVDNRQQQQEQDAANRQAASQLIGDLQKLQNSLIENHNNR